MNLSTNVTKTNIWSWLFRHQLGELRRAYQAARQASELERREIEKKWNELQERVDAGTARFVEEDEDGNVVIDWREQVGEELSGIEGIERIYREAFLISLYHFWERELLKQMKKKRYSDQEVFAFLRDGGCSPDELKGRCQHLYGDPGDAGIQID